MKSLDDFNTFQTLSSKFPESERWIFMFKGVYWVLYAKDFSQLSHWIHLIFREICIALQFPIVAMNSAFLIVLYTEKAL